MGFIDFSQLSGPFVKVFSITSKLKQVNEVGAC